MKTKFLIAFLAVTAVIVGGIVVLTSKETKEIFSPVAKKQLKPSSSPTVAFGKLKVYKDPSGFEFQYPDSVKIKKFDTTDESTYASLEVTSPNKTGSIIVSVTSSDLKNPDEWLKSEKISPQSEKIKKVKLADLDAYQYEDQKKIITVAVDTETLFLISLVPKGNSEFWKTLNNKIISSFIFQAPVAPANNSSETSSSGEEVIFEGEEIVE